MVGRFALLLVIPPLAVAEPIDEAWLRDQLAPAEAAHAQREARTPVAEGLTVPGKAPTPSATSALEAPSTAAPATANPAAIHTNAAMNNSVRPGPAASRPTTATTGLADPHVAQTSSRTDPDLYVPPPRVATVSTTASKTFDQPAQRFGILLGTWARARIERPITNADNGAVEVILDQALEGPQRTLPVGTMLFGDKGFNTTSQRLDVTLTRGITPEGEEFELVATLYDTRKLSGLAGTVVRERTDEVRSATAKGALSSARTLLAATVGQSAAGALADGVVQAGDELLDDEQRFVRPPQALIQVSPQPVLIRIERTF